MALELRHQMKMTQQLVMTPQLQLAIKLLQLSRLELLETVQQELQENPLLEEVLEDEEAKPEAKVEPSDDGLPEVDMEKTTVEDDFDWEAYLQEYSSHPPAPSIREDYDSAPFFENRLVKKPDLFSNLLWQLRLADLTEEEKEIGVHVIGNLNRDGYLKADLEEIAAAGGVEIEVVERVLKEIQRFDPVGVAARDLKECLLIQAELICPKNELVKTIIEEHLKHLERGDLRAVMSATGSSSREVEDAVSIIISMEPRPGRNMSSEDVQYISPDIYLHKVDDRFEIVLNEEGMPRLRVSEFYRDALTGGIEVPEATKKYIKKKLKSAAWLIRSIHQRERTIYKVTKAIVRFQREFFEKGVTFLKPLVLRDVAQEVGMHESTISRVTTNKYIHTPQGVFELKYFFNSSVDGTRGDSVSSEAVKAMIREIVASEDNKKPLSDKSIMEDLKKREVSIARRTVAKYRESLGILPASKRRRKWGGLGGFKR